MRATLIAVLLLAPLGSHAATFTVTRADDVPVSICTVNECTLRAAMLAADANPGADLIGFNVPAVGGVATIVPTTALPSLSGDDTTIDGYTQPGASVGNSLPARFVATITLHIDGRQVNASSGLRLAGNRNQIRGIAISGFDVAQIEILGSNNVVRGNRIGLNPGGAVVFPFPACGVRVLSAGAAPVGNRIGGNYSDDDINLIAGHRIAVLLDGVGSGSSLAEENLVAGNLINVGADGILPMPGEHGVHVRNSRNTRVGASDNSPFPDGNNIGGYGGYDRLGVVIDGGSRSFVDGNWIGGTASGHAHPIGTGILVTNGASEVFAQFNLIHHAQRSGIEVLDGSAAAGATGALLAQNSVLWVNGPAIDLRGDGPTANDIDDLDVGPNRLSNTPILTAARINGANYEIDFLLDAETNTNYGVEALLMNHPASTPQKSPLQKNPAPGKSRAVAAIPSSGGSVRTDANGVATGTLTVARVFVPQGYSIGATASRFVTFGNGNVSSEVSAAANFPALATGSVIAFDLPLSIVDYASGSTASTTVTVRRAGSADAAASVVVMATTNDASPALITSVPSIPPTGLLLNWAAGDLSPRTLQLSYFGPDPNPFRGTVRNELALSQPTGAVLGSSRSHLFVIANDEDAGFANAVLFGGAGGGFESSTPP